jgi:hypothetical protein
MIVMAGPWRLNASPMVFKRHAASVIDMSVMVRVESL